jgi:predicted DNA-binding antitoxin AbrB/MazE fold protein
MTIAAKFEKGVFKPLDTVRLKEGTVVDIHVPDEAKVKPRSIREIGFTGMWADREDITDGVSYVNRLRDNPRG